MTTLSGRTLYILTVIAGIAFGLLALGALADMSVVGFVLFLAFLASAYQIFRGHYVGDGAMVWRGVWMGVATFVVSLFVWVLYEKLLALQTQIGWYAWAVYLAIAVFIVLFVLGYGMNALWSALIVLFAGLIVVFLLSWGGVLPATPAQAALVADADGDGVGDDLDRCDDTKGPADNYGCAVGVDSVNQNTWTDYLTYQGNWSLCPQVDGKPALGFTKDRFYCGGYDGNTSNLYPLPGSPWLTPAVSLTPTGMPTTGATTMMTAGGTALPAEAVGHLKYDEQDCPPAPNTKSCLNAGQTEFIAIIVRNIQSGDRTIADGIPTIQQIFANTPGAKTWDKWATFDVDKVYPTFVWCAAGDCAYPPDTAFPLLGIPGLESYAHSLAIVQAHTPQDPQATIVTVKCPAADCWAGALR